MKSTVKLTSFAVVAVFFFVPPLPTRSAGAVPPAGPPQTARQAARRSTSPATWVSLIVDEWRFRVTPQKGDIMYCR